MQKKILIYGSGGLGKDVAWQLSELTRITNEFDILGFIDDNKERSQKIVNGIKVLGGMDWIASWISQAKASSDLENFEINILLAIANPAVRKRKHSELKNLPGVLFPSIVADGVKCSKYARLSEGCIILSSSIISPDAVLGDFTIVNYDCTVGHDSIIGDFTTLYPSVNVSGNVQIGMECEIGTGTNIIQGIQIGNNTIIGAGAVVIRDIPDNCTAVGVPAKPIPQKETRG